jgi:hypothetical protein
MFRVTGPRLTRLRAGYWVFAVALAAAQAWGARQFMNPDGISYLDLSDALLRGDWTAALNPCWSPLYPASIAAAKILARPFPVDEFTLAHLVNLVLFVGCLACFDRFLRAAARLRRAPPVEASSCEQVPAPALFVFGYGVFLWACLSLIGLRRVNPDLAMAGFVFLAASFLLEIGKGNDDPRTFASLGLALGLGCLAKAPFFPLSPIFFGVGLVAARKWRRMRGFLAAIAVFAAVTLPYIVALSVHLGRPTFGESGRLNYAWHVLGVPRRHWQGIPAGNGFPLHPTRQISVNPKAFEFATPVGGTYPVWYDPYYWYRGLELRFEPTKQLAQIRRSVGSYRSIFLNLQIRTLLSYDRFSVIASPLFLVAIVLCFLASQRYVAAFAAILYVALLSSFCLRPAMRPLATKAALAAGFAGASLVAVSLVRSALVTDPLPVLDRDTAVGLVQTGLRRGDRIASLDYSNRLASVWAHRAGLKIVAEVYEVYEPRHTRGEDSFWRASADDRRNVLEAFARAGAVAVVGRKVPSGTPGWQPIGRTGQSVLFLKTP